LTHVRRADNRCSKRHFNASLKNIAVWGYWTGVGSYGKGTPREGSPWFEALVGTTPLSQFLRAAHPFLLIFSDESGWAWFIPLHNSTTSIGVVMNQKASIRKNKKASPDSTLISRYIDNLNLAPGVVRLIGKGTLIEKGGETVRSASDFSYSAPSYAGNGYRIVGDAGGET
jgi:flavin-dependent dehydrogenase